MKFLVAAALVLATFGCSTAPQPDPTPTSAAPSKCVYLAGYYYVGKVMVPYYRPCPEQRRP